MAIFTGAGVAIVTPMKENGDVNYEVFETIIEDQIEGKTDAIIVCGTTGEASTLSHEEHLECIRFVVEKVNKRVPVIAGTGSNSTSTAIYLSQEAEKFGADGILVVSPYYNKATQKGLVEHFVQIADSVKIPVILYNVPSRTGCNILPETVLAIAEKAKNVVAVKEASGNISQVAKLASLVNGKVDIYSGNDDQIVPVLSLGGIGVISVLSNVVPKETHDIVEKYLNGDMEGSLKIQLDLMNLIDALFCEVNPIPVKAAMNLMGKEVGGLRSPLTVMEEKNQAVLKAEMEAFGLI